MSAENKKRDRRAYFREYYRRRKESDPKWYKERVKINSELFKKKYHEKQLPIFEKHANELAKMTLKEDIVKYLLQNFKLRGDKNE